jgi:hypothetical protein
MQLHFNAHDCDIGLYDDTGLLLGWLKHIGDTYAILNCEKHILEIVPDSLPIHKILLRINRRLGVLSDEW